MKVMIPRRISPSSESAGLPRSSRLATPATLGTVAAIAAIALLMVAVGGPLPRDADILELAHEDESLSTLPSADTPAVDLLCSISSPMTFSRFLTAHSHRYRHANPFSYTRNFRMTLEEFQRAGWLGDCNDFANAICELGHYHGYPMGLVSMWPTKMSERLRRDWHQIAVLCLREDEAYLIFEFERPIWWRGTLEEYAQAHDRTIMPMGGVIQWRPTKKNPLARFMDHLRFNAPLPENNRPISTPPAHPVT